MILKHINIKLNTLLLLGFISCSTFVQMADDQYFEEINTQGQNELGILFSHNINAEMHPCGCRQFPLGGLPQIFGLMESVRNKMPTIYIDSGDTFFETTIVPNAIRKSSEFKANQLAIAMDKLNLKLFTPGDQDFSLGEEFLTNISKKVKFKFLISNSAKMMKIKHLKLARFDTNGISLFFIGVLSPDLLKPQYRHLFIDPTLAIKKQLDTINIRFPNLKNKKIILLSHSGIETDRNFAENFPSIDWIVGAHSQSFLRYSVDVGQTQLVQVLSRNHHLGHITIPFSPKLKSKYKLLEARDEMKDLAKNNIMLPWVDKFKVKIDKIYKSEQNIDTPLSALQTPTYISCADCHTKQVDFWQSTAHASAFSTLVHANSAHNPSCVKCHSLGFQKEDGFLSTKKIILSENENFNIDDYWKEFTQKVKIQHPIRKLSSKSR